MKALINLWRSEPVAILGVLQALVVVASAFGLHLTQPQIAALASLAAALAAVVGRTQVTPK